MPQRRPIKFNSMDDVIADVERLRRSDCARCGQWTLAQICSHLDMALTYAMSGTKTPNTPEQDAARPRLDNVLASGQLPAGIQGPPQLMPPPDVPDAAIDSFIATAKRFAAFPGPFGPHRRFGNIGDDVIRRLVLIHAAHHLSHFVPRDAR